VQSFALHAILMELHKLDVPQGLGSPSPKKGGGGGSPSKKAKLGIVITEDLSVFDRDSEQMQEFEAEFLSAFAEVLKTDSNNIQIANIAPYEEEGEVRGAAVDFIVNKALDDARKTKPKTLALRLTSMYRDFQDASVTTTLDTGYFSDLLDAEASLMRSLPERVKYLEDTALDLVHGLPADAGACLGKPPATDDSVPSPLILAAASGRGFLARAIIDRSGNAMTVTDAKDLMQFYANLLADADRDSAQADASLVDELVSSVVKHSDIHRSEKTELLRTAVETGLEGTVRLLLSMKASKGGGLLHLALKMLGKATHLPYIEIIKALLEAGASANEIVQGIAPLEAALGSAQGDWPHRSVDQVDAAGLLLRYGAHFNTTTFKLALSEWEKGTSDTKRTEALEECVAQMVRSGVDYSICGKGGRSVIDVAVAVQSTSVLSAVLDAQGERFDKKVNEQFGTYDVDNSNTLTLDELIERQGLEAGESLFNQINTDGDQVVSREEWLEFLLAPMRNLFLDICFGKSSLLLDKGDSGNTVTFQAKLCDLLIHANMPALHILVQKTGRDHQHVPVQVIQAMCDPDSGISEDFDLSALGFSSDGEPMGTVLHVACAQGLDEVVAELLQQGASKDVMDERGDTPLSVAISCGHVSTIKTMLDQGAELPLGMLSRAALADNLHTTELILEAGGHVDERNTFQRTALHACSQSFRINGGRPWYDLATYNDAPKVAKALLSHNASVDMRDIGGETPLAVAVQNARENVGAVLLEHEAEPLVQDRTGHSPLARAIAAGCGRSFLHSLIDCCSLGAIADDPYSVVYAIRSGDVEIANRLYDRSEQMHLYRGWPALWWACFSSQQGMQSELLSIQKLSSAVIWRDGIGRTLLHWLAIGWQPKGESSSPASMVLQLTQAGLGVMDTDGALMTPLELAAQAGNAPMVKCLMDLNGATEETRANAAQLARRNGFIGIAVMLSGEGEDPEFSSDTGTAAAQSANLGFPFVDPKFPPVLCSLTGGKAQYPPAYARVEWIRASVLCGEGHRMFPNGPIGADTPVETGVAGSCYFWSSILMAGDNTLRGMFSQRAEDRTGVYNITCMKEGVPVVVIIDEFIPCIDGIPAFGRAGEPNEMWSMLLCKAAAKLYGSYADFFVGKPALSSWACGAASQLGGSNGLFDMKAAPLLELADQMHGCSIVPAAPPDAADFVQRLSETFKEDVANIGIPAEPVFSSHMPQFVLTCEQDTELNVLVTGAIPSDFEMYVDNKTSEEVASFNVTANPTCVFQLYAEQCPYRILFHTDCSEEEFEAVDFDFQSARVVNVECEGFDDLSDSENAS